MEQIWVPAEGVQQIDQTAPVVASCSSVDWDHSDGIRMINRQGHPALIGVHSYCLLPAMVPCRFPAHDRESCSGVRGTPGAVFIR